MALTLRLVGCLEQDKYIVLFKSLTRFSDIIKYTYHLKTTQLCIEILISLCRSKQQVREFLFNEIEPVLKTFIETSISYFSHFNNYSGAELSYIDLTVLDHETLLRKTRYIDYLDSDSVSKKFDLEGDIGFEYGDFNTIYEK